MPPRESVKIVGGPGDHELRDFLTRGDQPYEWLDERAGRSLLERHGVVGKQLPVVVIDDAVVLVSPSLEELADALGVRQPPKAGDYDVVIVGAGPAGLAAAVYAAADGLSVAVAERSIPGGQASYTSQIENYFGIDPLGPPMTGAHLARIGGRQAETFGAEILILRGVVSGRRRDDGRHEVELSSGEKLNARAAIVASGVEWRRLEVDGVEELLGRGVYFGAGRSEAPFLAGKHAVVVGAGNAAGQAVLNLAERAERVTMLCRGRELGGSLSAYLVDRIEAHPRIDVRLGSEVTAVAGDDRLREITVNGSEVLPVDGMFLAIGGRPRTTWAAEQDLVTDSRGYLVTGHDLLEGGRPPESWPLERPPLALEASVPGIFVAGDVRHGSIKRVAGAVGEGAMAAALIHQYLGAAGSAPR
jgi:thioredoxin reductase (NADPH)